MEYDREKQIVVIDGQELSSTVVEVVIGDLLAGRAVLVSPMKDEPGQAHVTARSGVDGDRVIVSKRKMLERHVGLYARQVAHQFGRSSGWGS